MINRSLIVLCLITIIEFYGSSCSLQPEVKIEQGVVRGLYSKTFGNRQFSKFEGIPYAKPPVGKHRFKEPVPADPWLGIYNATREPPQCLQYDSYFTKSISGSEDCLYINVYTPEVPDDQKNPKLLDVIAYIHGGAFFMGKSGFLGPNLILERDIVFVTFNYRLGPLGGTKFAGSASHLYNYLLIGFFSTGDDVVPGNNGLKDQVLALKWIKKNIAAFGGDPNSITLGGGSAGGVSCHYHTISPLSKGLFKGAICTSGVALNPWALMEDSKEKGMFIADSLGCPTNDSLLMVKCLRNRPAEHIVEPFKSFFYWNKIFPLAPFGPVVEPASPTAFIPDSPINMLRDKSGSDVPLLITFARDEGLCGGSEFIVKPQLFSELLDRWDELAPHLLDYNGTAPSETRLDICKKVKAFYKLEDSSEGARNAVKMLGDRMFVAGISKVAKLGGHVYTSPIYVYRFSYRGKHSGIEFLYPNLNLDLGVGHGEDLLYTLSVGNMNLIETEADSEVSKQILDVWITFAANGSLTGNWQPVNEQEPKLVFTDIKGPNNFQLTAVEELGEESFWDSLGLKEDIKPRVSSHEEL